MRLTLKIEDIAQMLRTFPQCRTIQLESHNPVGTAAGGVHGDRAETAKAGFLHTARGLQLGRVAAAAGGSFRAAVLGGTGSWRGGQHCGGVPAHAA